MPSPVTRDTRARPHSRKPIPGERRSTANCSPAGGTRPFSCWASTTRSSTTTASGTISATTSPGATDRRRATAIGRSGSSSSSNSATATASAPCSDTASRAHRRRTHRDVLLSRRLPVRRRAVSRCHRGPAPVARVGDHRKPVRRRRGVPAAEDRTLGNRGGGRRPRPRLHPHCGFAWQKTMPTDACQFYEECPSCHTLLRPKPGHCFVFCSYGSVPCPPIQLQRGCCSPPM